MIGRTANITNFNQLNWVPVTNQPNVWRAEVNATTYIIKQLFLNNFSFFSVYKNGQLIKKTSQQIIENDLRTGAYNDPITIDPPGTVYYTPPPPITPRTPAIDPPPGNNSAGGFTELFEEYKIYFYGAAAIIAIALITRK